MRKEEKQTIGTEVSRMEKEIIAVGNPPVLGEKWNMNQENKMDEGIILNTDMQVDVENPDQLKGSGLRR